MSVNLPRPGAPRMDNLIATLLLAGNGSHTLKLDVIAGHQGFDAAEFRARFAQLETQWSLKTTQEEWDGK